MARVHSSEEEVKGASGTVRNGGKRRYVSVDNIVQNHDGECVGQ
jgi:hypothetical protein